MIPPLPFRRNVVSGTPACRRALTLLRFATLVSLLTFLLAIAATPHLTTVAAEDFGQPDPNRRIYDQAGILTTAEIERLEEAAVTTTTTGAPTIVYLRRQEADAEGTVEDAAELMEAWAIESALGAKDGLVVFLNVDPDDPGRFDVGLWAGETHADGDLPERELERIVAEEILPPLREEQVAAALLAGLDAAAVDLRFGPPPPPEPSDLERAAATFARWPLAAIGLVGAAALGLLTAKTLRDHPAGRPQKLARTLQVPGYLPPAIAGALVAGRIRPEQHVATILDLAGRGALALEPAPSRKKGDVQLLLVDESVPRSEYEREVWNALQGLAEREVIPPKAIAKLSGRFGPADASLKSELAERGWWDQAILKRRVPLLWSGSLALAVAVVGLIATIVGEEPLGLIGVLVLAGAGVIALSVAAVFSQATAVGQAQAAPWRALQAGLNAARRDEATVLDEPLDEVLPFAVALGAAGAIDRRLKAASAEGRAPLAFRQGIQGDAWAGGFYPYWVGFSTSSGASDAAGAGVTGATAGGAAAGGAGAGGST